jgi:hypothetical protein
MGPVRQHEQEAVYHNARTHTYDSVYRRSIVPWHGGKFEPSCLRSHPAVWGVSSTSQGAEALAETYFRTISKINDCLSTIQKGGRLRRILYNAELSAKIQECIFRLDGSLEEFQVIQPFCAPKSTLNNHRSRPWGWSGTFCGTFKQILSPGKFKLLS